MKTSNLEKLKNTYQQVRPPVRLQEYGWGELYAQMNGQTQSRSWLGWQRFSFALFSLLIILGGLFGFIKVTLAATPDQALYPVKKAIEKVIETTTGNNQVSIDNRAEEIIDLSQDKQADSTYIKETAKEYVQEVEQAKQKINDSQKDNTDEQQPSKQEDSQLQQKLDEHHQAFDEVIKNDPSLEGDLKEAVEVSDNHQEDKKEEVKGSHEDKPQEESNQGD